MPRLFGGPLWLLFVGCSTPEESGIGDAVQDTSSSEVDGCGDTDASTYVGAADQSVDGVDQDCDGVDGPDADGDGHADAAFGGDDCADTDASTYAGAPDVSVDGKDQDCDGLDGPDADGDGFADAQAGGADCDDHDATSFPGAKDGSTDGVDQDCDGLDGPDSDGDGYADATTGGDDCGELDPRTSPGAAERDDTAACMTDLDGDGHGESHPADGVTAGADCDDSGAFSCLLLGEWSGFGFVGEAAGDYAHSAASAGDVDGDGLDDVVVAAWGSDRAAEDAGAAYILLGSTLGGVPRGDLGLATADYVLVGLAEGDKVGGGWSISPAGDLDMDGLGDVLVAAPFGAEGGDDAGTTYVILGSTLRSRGPGEMSLADADWSLVGEGEADQAGWSVGTAGDVDGDGVADVLVAARNNDESAPDAGKAYLVLGASLERAGPGAFDLASADAAYTGEASGDGVASVASGGDVNGDGHDDLFFGAADNDDGGDAAGKAYLVLTDGNGGPARGSVSLGDAEFQFIGEASDDWAGSTVASAGDTDGDGRADLLIGAPRNSGTGAWAGKAYLFLASSLAAGGPGEFGVAEADYGLSGTAGGDWAGLSVSTGGDVDGDGLADLLVGAIDAGDWLSEPGMAYLVLARTLAAVGPGTLPLEGADVAFHGEGEHDSAGIHVAAAGDVDGDGLGDLLVGAFGNDAGGEDAGKSYLVFGAWP